MEGDGPPYDLPFRSQRPSLPSIAAEGGSSSSVDSVTTRSALRSHAIACSSTSSRSQSPSNRASAQQQDGASAESSEVYAANAFLAASLLKAGSSVPELPQDPDLHEALINVTRWHAGTYQELQSLPQRSPNLFSATVASNHGLWSWLFGLSGSRSAGVLHPFTREEQQALVEGHTQLRRRMRALQPFLINLSQLVGKRALGLQQAGSALVHTLNDNARLLHSIDFSKDTTQQHHAKLTQAIIHLEVAHTKVEELEGAVAQLRAEVAAGVALAQEMEAKIKGLECSSKEVRAAHKRQMELLEKSRTELQDKYTYAQGLQAELGNLKSLCSLQERDLQCAAQQLEAATRKAQAAVTRVEQRGAAERQRLREVAAALQVQLSGTQVTFTETKDKLVRTGAEIDAMMAELPRLQEAMEEETEMHKLTTATNSAYRRDLKQQKEDLQQLVDEDVALLRAQAKVLGELASYHEQGLELMKQAAAKDKEKGTLKDDKLKLRTKVLEDKARNGLQVLDLDAKITAAKEAKVKAMSDYNEAKKLLDTCKYKTEQKEASFEKYIAQMSTLRANTQALQEHAPEYARAKEAVTAMGKVEQKLGGMKKKKENQINGPRDLGNKERKAKEARKAGEEMIKQLASEKRQLEKALAKQQREISGKQRDTQAAHDVRAKRIADQEAAHTSLQEKLDANPRLLQLLEQLDVVKGKLDETNAKVEQRLKARTKMEKDLATAYADIAGCDVAVEGADKAIQVQGKVVKQQQMDVDRARAAMASQEARVGKLESQIRKLRRTTQMKAELQADRRQLLQQRATLRKELGKPVSDAVEAAAHAEGVGVATWGAGVVGGRQQGQGSSEQAQAASWGAEQWPSLADTTSLPVEVPRGGR